jgi:hypothetical protein
MKFIKIFASLFVVLTLCTSATIINKQKGIYIVGVSASFTDSLIYFTPVQWVDSVKLDKNKLIPFREQYSDQLDNYLEKQQGMKDRTCFIYFGTKKGKLENMIQKMKNKYQKKGGVALKEVGADFKFTKAAGY